MSSSLIDPASAETDIAEPDAAAGANVLVVFCGLAVTMLLASLNNTMLASALPAIIEELDGVESLTWVITAYILASTITMPIYGKISDVFGRRPVLLVAISLFIAGSVIGGIAPDMAWLIIARAIQGLGGGGLIILAQAAIADVVPARQRGTYMGAMGGVFAVSSVAGPLLGGWLTEGPGWRWSFWVNLPLGLLALLATVFLLRLPARPRDTRPRLDYAGMALVAVVTSALVLVGTWGGTRYEWVSPEILGLAAVALVAAVLFVLVESRASLPIIPLVLFSDRNFVLTTIAALLLSIPMFGVIGYLPTYLQMAAGVSATAAGLLMIPMMGALLGLSVISGEIVSRTGRYKVVPIIGSVLVSVGLVLLGTLSANGPIVLLCICIGIIGVGLGASLQILTLVAQNSFPLKMVGAATASTNYFRQVGATLGTAVVGSIFAARLVELQADTSTVAGSYHEALIPLFLWMAPLAAITAIALCFVEEKPLATHVEPHS